jgi:DNA processing protein
MRRFGVRVHGAGSIRKSCTMRRTRSSFCTTRLDLVKSRSVAVVETRKPTQAGLARTHNLVRALVEDNFTIVSGPPKP